MSVRGRRRRATRMPTMAIRATGNNHPASRPTSPVTRRVTPGDDRSADGPSDSRSDVGTTGAGRSGAAGRRPYDVPGWNRATPLYSKTCSYTESFRLPSTYGRSAAGTNETAVIQLSDTATAMAPPIPSRAVLRLSRPGAATAYATPSAGRIAHASIIFAWNASPTTRPLVATVRTRPFRIARSVVSAATTMSRTQMASAVLPRLMMAVAGTAAVIAAAATPARAPATRRTARNMTTTVST